MGPLEPQKEITSHELGLVIEVVAETEDLSRTDSGDRSLALLHSTYPGRKAIAGNLAFPFSPSDIGVGDVYEFNVYHLLETGRSPGPVPHYLRGVVDGEGASRLQCCPSRYLGAAVWHSLAPAGQSPGTSAQ